MQSFNLKDIIKQKKSKVSGKQITAQLESSPYNQVLHRWNKGKNDKAQLLYVYDWQSFVNPSLSDFNDDIKELSSIKIKDKKRIKKKEQKAIAFNTASASNEIKKEKEQSKKEKGPKSTGKVKKEKVKKASKNIKSKKDKGKKLKLAVVEYAAPTHWNQLSNVSIKPIDSFTQWINTIDPRYDLDQVPAPAKSKKSSKKKSKKPNPIKSKIESSIQSKDQIVSEHLAKLYMDQGYYTKALDMYERLSLKNPEKSHFFAPLIEELKSKI